MRNTQEQPTVAELEFTKMDAYYYQAGDYTICHAKSVLKPFAVFYQGEPVAYETQFKRALVIANRHNRARLAGGDA